MPDVSSSVDQVKRLGRYVIIRRIVTTCCVFCSALIQAFVIQAFVNPANLLSSGFTGLAILVDRITSLMGLSFPTSLGMVLFNLPVAAICWKSISKRFVIFSMMQVGLASLFLQVCDFDPILDNTILNVLFGGVLNGMGIAIALKGGASTAGTDFIAQLVSMRTGRTIWNYVFLFNCLMLLVFGAIFGWEYAAFSIVFQFLSTRTINSFYHRYEQSTLQVTTKRADEVLAGYTTSFHHGAMRLDGVGGYSGEPYSLITTVVSVYETSDVIKLIRTIDPHAVINVMRTEQFVGNFHRAPADEPLPTQVDETPETDPVAALGQSIRRGIEHNAETVAEQYGVSAERIDEVAHDVSDGRKLLARPK